MNKVKKLAKYVIWLILFYIFSDIMINIGLNTVYKNIENKSKLSQVTITKAESTNVDGRIYGQIDLDKNSALIGKYIKVDLYSKRDILLGRDYIKIEKNGNEKIQTFQKHFKYNNVSYYDLSIINEEQKQKEIKEITDKSLFSGFTLKPMSTAEKVWIAIIAVALIS